ncbi:response regulator [Acidithiobacillus sp. CV18-2]|uniref:Response regulator n=1 Tax=Igneacidithiobacillus copahuensis TaxID=2724909 RepID=A0AAE2YRN4_9PROT|nr:response regulator [Igneacidithiobacillus copahuensis]MBU2755439.1 response regulator [Acidithiobacillus sp. CV18-3]MBU2757963.1 response regulator [Acidithiobacillus sp. BN09-2]MBU2777979.1 response regulator [Acidithiobacillus sp. CV18-2]MBU2795819.1 response regulator [Acidithiobacillus sp. VAN18-2]MBU2799356.1 response regulator [Acidithiobacillus sp. VAN18-4]UTV80179.1 response regulator [Acidithiobacillus sp. YTS05]
MKLLLAEDDARNRDMLGRRLQRRGFTVIEAENGLVAVQATKAHGPQIILMDLAMPEMSGWEAIERIREYDPTVPIIVLSAHSLGGEQERALALGAQAYLSKPIDFEPLLGSIKELINS